MSLRNNIDEDYKKAIKNKEQDKTNTLRLIKSAIKDKDISSRTNENKDGISDQEILSLLISLIKQRKDSIDAFEKANRQDLIDKEKAEISVIELFLPKQKSENETKEIIENIIRENNFSSIKDMGKLMNLIKSNYTGVIDMGVAGKIAKNNLGK